MKALKEKRNGLRSLLRMGLVILSVFAIAFAACGNSGSGDNNTPAPTEAPTNGNGGEEPPPETQPATPPRYAQSIVVIPQPTHPTGGGTTPGGRVAWAEFSPTPRINYEGQRPYLNGMTVEIRWNDNTREVVELGGNASEDFITVPYFCPDPYLVGSQYYPSSGATGVRPTYNQTTWTLSSGVKADMVDVANAFEPIPFTLAHKSNPAYTVNIKIAYIRPISRFSWNGSTTKTKYLEDDVVIDPSGVSVTAWYGSDLQYDGQTLEIPVQGYTPGGPLGPPRGAFANFTDKTGITFSNAANSVLKPEIIIIPMTSYNVDATYGSKDYANYFNGINLDDPAKPLIRLRLGVEDDAFTSTASTAKVPGATNTGQYFKEHEVEIHRIRGLGVENYEPTKLPDFFQFDTEPWAANKTSYSGKTGKEYWTDQLFNTAGLVLKVYYAGTDVTKTMGYAEYKRAEALKLADLVALPDLTARDVESVVARFAYYMNRNTQDPVFPNEELAVSIPVLEFDGEIQFVKKEMMPPIPLQFRGYNASGDANNPTPPHALRAPHVRAVAETYDLVAVYAGGKTKLINDLLWVGSYNTGRPRDLTSWGANYNFRNMTDEVIERELRLTLNLATSGDIDRTGNTSYNGLKFYNGSGASVSGKNAIDGSLRTYNAFNNRRADLEEAVEILPWVRTN